jgi:hypothetical protein
MTIFCERKWTFLATATYCLIAGLNAWMVLQADDDSTQATAKKVTTRAATSQLDRSRFMGARTCIDCHRSEYVSWLKTAHYSNRVNRFEDTESSIDTKYRELTGNVDLCYNCHTLPAKDRFGRVFVESGTSCESCHGAAGSENGWLNRHAVYGPNVTRLDQETPEHFADRIAFCEDAGMVRPGRQYSIAKNCLGCHIAGDAMLFEAGHKVSFDNFSLIPYMLGEVRHNFHMNQRHNAKSPTLDTKRRGLSAVHRVRLYFIVEQLARMEVALNYLAKLPNEEAMETRLADELIGIFDDAAGELEEFAEVLMEEPDPAGESLSEPEAKPLLAAVEEFERFQDLESPTRADASASAERISAVATEFLMSHNGRRLGALDVEFLEDLGDAAGKALEP